ncbi:MAG: toxin-antitoxin system HicB family antitoxin [Gemmatimonadetes bacterium]|nr:toxin-antitoxin system HicB family antitoxin [Gemmatimonadota bacterium]MYF73023.1 toxin-antitoxin system HicB family antitoxin [Gemmatimonadota bacterium]MYK50993.1 toxin-antitoxin system HicB family antitoxin [Gemmatimonadota bacterium]
MTTISLTIPDSLHATVRDIIEREGMSLEQFIMLAMAEKASAIATETYLEARAKRGSREKFLAAMAKVADVEPSTDQDRI